jgi:hypothetical protein
MEDFSWYWCSSWINGYSVVSFSSPKTASDLEAEMYRWVTGQEDEHDRVVREEKERIRERCILTGLGTEEQFRLFRRHCFPPDPGQIQVVGRRLVERQSAVSR